MQDEQISKETVNMGWGMEGGREDAVQAERVLEKSESEVFHRCFLVKYTICYISKLL